MKFYDIHCHLMGVSEPDFLAFFKHLVDNMGKEALNSMMTPDILLEFRNKKLPSKLGNLINVMSHSQSEMAGLIEKDLSGEFGSGKAYYNDSRFKIFGRTFDKYVIVPLIMDFRNNKQVDSIYYNSKPQKDAFTYANNLLSEIKVFYDEAPDSFLEICPFAGITPPAYTKDKVQEWLETYFGEFDASPSEQNRSEPRFFGIKLYPPLGVSPWPKAGEEREKMEMIYAYAQEKRIPITTHCDDEGYRVDSPEVTQPNTSPDIWAEVLEYYPDLKLDFAHFGNQFHRNRFLQKKEEWRDKIIDLMDEYDGVYSDISFNGVFPDYYEVLDQKMKKMDDDLKQALLRKLMFGTDFSINLSKVGSYNDYLQLYEDSPLMMQDKLAFATSNCERFLFE